MARVAQMAWAVPQGRVRPAGGPQPSGRSSKPLRDGQELHRRAVARLQGRKEVQGVGAHDERDAIDAGPRRIENGVVHEGLTAGPERGELLVSPETGAHAGSQ